MTYGTPIVLLRQWGHPSTAPTSDRERYNELVRMRLIDCGWRVQVKTMCREFIASHGGGRYVTREMLSQHVMQRACAMVPQWLRTELAHEMRENYPYQHDE